MILVGFDLLPGLDRGSQGPLFSMWCVHSGFIVTTLVLLLWRSQNKIFLDRICINQQDDDLKAQAIFSLAGLLKRSDVVLILWDLTWTERLWCLFELAAFSKSKKAASRKQALIINAGFLDAAHWLWDPSSLDLSPLPSSFSVMLFAFLWQRLQCQILRSASCSRSVLGLLVGLFPELGYHEATAPGDFLQIRRKVRDVSENIKMHWVSLCFVIERWWKNVWTFGLGAKMPFEQHVRSEVLEILTLSLQ